MRRTGTFILLTIFMAAFTANIVAQDKPDIFIKDLEIPVLRWGQQQANFQAINNTGYPKYLAVLAEVQFSDSYLSPYRLTKSFYILPPEDTIKVSAPVNIPGNYGRASIMVKIYDVVDTNDIILEGSKFYEQPFTIRYHLPEAIEKYFSEKISMPPMVEAHPRWDNEFARALLYMIDEGKTAVEIAELAKADEWYVSAALGDMVRGGYVNQTGEKFSLKFPAIKIAEAQKGKDLAERTSTRLAEIISGNMPTFKLVLDNLISSGTVSADANEFLNGGSILHHRYPTISILALWFNLGQKFIQKNSPLLIYDGTDLCNAEIKDYMYAVQGGDFFNGTNFYYQHSGRKGMMIFYGSQIPTFDCEENFTARVAKKQMARWQYREEFKPEDFMVDTAVVSQAIAALVHGTDSLLTDSYFELQKISNEYGRANVELGERYWFWNLVATRTLRKLEDMKVINHEGNGQFRLRGM